MDVFRGREASPVGRPDFKSGKGREAVFGGFELPFSSASITEWRDKDSYLGIADSSSCEGISAACFR